jgi:hypothetical protein
MAQPVAEPPEGAPEVTLKTKPPPSFNPTHTSESQRQKQKKQGGRPKGPGKTYRNAPVKGERVRLGRYKSAEQKQQEATEKEEAARLKLEREQITTALPPAVERLPGLSLSAPVVVFVDPMAVRFVRPGKWFRFFRRHPSGEVYLTHDEVGYPLELIQTVANEDVVIVEGEDREETRLLMEAWEEIKRDRAVDGPDADG